MSTTNPLPKDSEYIRSTRQSCKLASEAFGLTPNIPAIDAFLHTLDQPTFEKLRTQHGLSFPLCFPNPTAEVNFLSTLALLNSFSGYRTAFHKATGIGAYQNVVRLMIGLYISGGEEDRVVGSTALTAKGMSEMSEGKVVELLGVSVHEEKEHDTLPGVTVGVRGGAMFDVVQLILSALNNVGTTLLAKGYTSLGAYIVDLLKETKRKNMDDKVATDYLVRSIAETFPEFQDTHPFFTTTTESPAEGREVYLFKRIFFLLHSLHLRFPRNEDWLVPNTYKSLPMLVDNVLPTLCVWFNFFNSPSSTTTPMSTLYNWIKTAHCNSELPRSKLDTLLPNISGPQLSADETYAIRAATLNLGQVIVARAKLLASKEGLDWLKGLNEVDLDAYLWSVAKDDSSFRKVPRLVFPSIHF